MQTPQALPTIWALSLQTRDFLGFAPEGRGKKWTLQEGRGAQRPQQQQEQWEEQYTGRSHIGHTLDSPDGVSARSSTTEQ